MAVDDLIGLFFLGMLLLFLLFGFFTVLDWLYQHRTMMGSRMIRVLVFIGGFLGLGVAVLGLISVRSDIQLIFAAVGFFSALIMFSIGAVLGRLDKQWNYLIDIEEEVRRERHKTSLGLTPP